MTAWPASLYRLSLVLGLTLALVAPLAAQDDFEISQATTSLQNGRYSLDANIELDFSEPVLEALGNGVPLTIVTHIQVRRKKAWLWEDSLMDQQVRAAIRFKPLSETYEVYRLPGTSGRSFVSREAAIRALGEISALPLVRQEELGPDEDYEVQIKAFLDIEELPLPLRPIAYLKPSWKLSSGWSKWPLTP